MRELVEENVEEIVAPYLEAVRSAVVIAKHEGEVHTFEVADHGARINAAERLLNRVYGRPRQEVELGASETGAPLAIVATDDRAAADAAREFLAKLIPDA
jgi:hypothetical protein